MTNDLRLPPGAQALLDAPYPQFSAAELHRRREAVEAVMARLEVDHLVAYGIGTRGGAVGWLSQWVATTLLERILLNCSSVMVDRPPW